MILLIIIIALVLVIAQSASTNEIVNTPHVYHHTHETHSYFINDRKVSKQEFDNSFKPFFNS